MAWITAVVAAASLCLFVEGASAAEAVPELNCSRFDPRFETPVPGPLDVRAGFVTLVGIREAQEHPEAMKKRAAALGGWKVPVNLETTGQSVRIRIANEDRRHAALEYEGRTLERLAEGASELKFIACRGEKNRSTTFPGGIAVTQASCVRLQVVSKSFWKEFVVGFGVASSSCRHSAEWRRRHR